MNYHTNYLLNATISLTLSRFRVLSSRPALPIRDAGHGWREGKKERTAIREKCIWPAETTLTSLGLLANTLCSLCGETVFYDNMETEVDEYYSTI